MNDPRYKAPVGGMASPELSAKLQDAIVDLQRRFPNLGVTLFVFDFGGGGGMSYISNADRESMNGAIREWLRKQAEDN